MIMIMIVQTLRRELRMMNINKELEMGMNG